MRLGFHFRRGNSKAGEFMGTVVVGVGPVIIVCYAARRENT